MESNDSGKFKENKKRFKMSLLFIQTKELRNLYNSQLKIIPRKYHLINKNWLDSYKNSNSYNYAIDMFNNYNDWEDYSDFKKKIIKYFPIENSKFTVFGVGDALDNILNFSLNKEKIPNFNLSFPNDCELVREEFFKDCSKGSVGFPIYEIYIGNKLIIIKDSETQNVVFLCSLKENQDNINNFLIKVNCLLAFDCESYMKNEIEQIIAFQSLNNYLDYRKINLNVYDQQIIENQDGKRLGILFIIKNKQSTEKNNQNNLIIQKNVELNNEKNNNDNKDILIDNIINNENNQNQNILRTKNNNHKINTKNYNDNNHNNFSNKNFNNNGNINNFNINNDININNSINNINNFNNNFDRNNYNNHNINNKSANSFNDINTNLKLNNFISPSTNNIINNQMDSIFNTNNNQNNNHFQIQNNNKNSYISNRNSSESAIYQNNSSNLFNKYNQDIYSNSNYMNNLSNMYKDINFNNNNNMSSNNNYYNNNFNFINNQQNFNGNNMSNINNVNMNNLCINNNCSTMST